MRNFQLPIAVFAAWLSAAPLAFAQGQSATYSLDQNTGLVEFHATGHPSAIKIVGKGTAPKGSFTLDGKQVKGSAQFDLTTLDTGIDMRNKHMKEKYLEVQKYPQATLTINQMDLPQPFSENMSQAKVPFAGKLSLHGVEQSVSGSAQIEKKKDRLVIDATFPLKIKDYGITEPKFAGISMADEVQVSVQSSVKTTQQ